MIIIVSITNFILIKHGLKPNEWTQHIAITVQKLWLGKSDKRDWSCPWRIINISVHMTEEVHKLNDFRRHIPPPWRYTARIDTRSNDKTMIRRQKVKKLRVKSCLGAISFSTNPTWSIRDWTHRHCQITLAINSHKAKPQILFFICNL
jgi:hypothetical protein